MTEPRGYVLWEGPSAINGVPAVAITTLKSVNSKTGPMAQVWFLAADVLPTTAAAEGDDEAVCGQCQFRPLLAKAKGVTTCYVTLIHGPNQIWKGYQAGAYPNLPRGFRFDRPVRFGAYGDPATLPTPALRRLADKARHGWTAYTHQWRRRPGLADVCMASVDTLDEQLEATALGFRTFRVVQKNDHNPAPIRLRSNREITCPAADHWFGGVAYGVGERTTCERCMLCDGRRTDDRRANIYTEAH